MANHKILGIFANHTSNMIKYNVSLNNISILKKHLTNIIIIDSKDEEYSIKLQKDLENDTSIIKHIFIKNDNYYDFGKWIYVLKTLNINKLNEYDYILFINDSIIITPNIKNYFIYLNNNVPSNINLYGYNDSTQLKYHYQSYFFAIKRDITNKFIKFFESRKNKIVDLESLVHNIELNICEIDPNHDCLIKIGNEYNMTKNIYWENEVLYKFLLSKEIFAIFKLKKIFDFYKDYKIIISGYSIKNFDYKFYEEQYDDINNKNMTDKELLEHFVKIGQFEGRKCNPKCNVILPDYYRDKLDSIGMLYFFDLPFDFDVYYYKKYYSDIEKLSVLDSIFHYLNCGVYQQRRYNKINTSNSYINNFYINILKNNNKIDNSYVIHYNFSVYAYYLSNIFHSIEYKNTEKGNLGLIYEFINNNNFLDKYTTDEIHKLLSLIDYDIYKKMHPELSKVDNIEIIKHYLLLANKDVLYRLPIDFDYNTYQKIYNDIRNLNPYQLKQHYIEYGYKENRIYKIPSDFNANVYRDLYSNIYNELSSMSDTEIQEHYLYIGVKNNRIYKIPSDFESDRYKKIYEDLKHLNNIQLIEHYMNIGIRENRIYKIPSDFNPDVYKRIYPELGNINDINNLSDHYLFNGLGTGYIYKLPKDFNSETYKKIYNLQHISDDDIQDYYLFEGIRKGHIYKLPYDFNPELYKKIYQPYLDNLNTEQLIEHYLFTGISNGYLYKIPSDFNVQKYIKIYNDLTGLNETTAKNHYLLYGIREKRIYKIPTNFNIDIYKKIYGLEHMSNDEINDYYLFNGIKNKHIYGIPSDFDANLYKNINGLYNLNNDELVEHYLYSGVKNGLIYKLPDDFNAHMYRQIYKKDLDGLNDEELTNHYLSIGIKEHRIYKIPHDFDCNMYRMIYNDLEMLTDSELINHYLFYGISERRIYNINDFDANIYKQLYKDLENLSDNQLKWHYMKYGIHEGRVYKV